MNKKNALSPVFIPMMAQRVDGGVKSDRHRRAYANGRA